MMIIIRIFLLTITFILNSRDYIHLHAAQNIDDYFCDVPSFAVFDGHGGVSYNNILVKANKI